MPTIRQMYAGTYNFYKTIYNGGKIYRQTANNKISQNNFSQTAKRGRRATSSLYFYISSAKVLRFFHLPERK